jgi:hypothetical protein
VTSEDLLLIIENDLDIYGRSSGNCRDVYLGHNCDIQSKSAGFDGMSTLENSQGERGD